MRKKGFGKIKGVSIFLCCVFQWLVFGSTLADEFIEQRQEKIEGIVTLLNHKDYNVRWAATVALGNLGDQRAAEPLIQSLEGSMNKDYYIVRVAAVNALGKLQDTRGIDALIRAMRTDREALVQESAASALVKVVSGIESPRRPASVRDRESRQKIIKELIGILANRKEKSYVRGLAADSLGKIGDPEAVKELNQIASSDPDKHVRGKAIDALALIGDPSATKYLKQSK
ncbi:MAG: HEAT repeat domain-containing protein [Deltaproteobacteria bacterium]|nr:HEAT repeat domain-containing protein [Deltaproteobacteria bacterium]